MTRLSINVAGFREELRPTEFGNSGRGSLQCENGTRIATREIRVAGADGECDSDARRDSRRRLARTAVRLKITFPRVLHVFVSYSKDKGARDREKGAGNEGAPPPFSPARLWEASPRILLLLLLSPSYPPPRPGFHAGVRRRATNKLSRAVPSRRPTRAVSRDSRRTARIPTIFST